MIVASARSSLARQSVLLVGVHGGALVQIEALEVCRRTGEKLVARNRFALVLQAEGTDEELGDFLAQRPACAITQRCRREFAAESAALSAS